MFHLLLLLASFLLTPFIPRDEGEGGSNGSGDSDGDGNGDGGGGSGDDDGDPDDDDDSDSDPDEELAKWKKMARKWERRAKESSKAITETRKELDELKRRTMSDQDKEIEKAKEEARNEVRAQVGAKLVEAEIKVKAAGRLSDEAIETLIENLNTSKFLTDDGDVDTDMVAELVDGIVPAKGDDNDPGKGKGKRPDMGQGRRKGSSKASVTTGADRYRERHGSTKKE